MGGLSSGSTGRDDIPSSDLNFDAFGSSTGFSGQLGPDSFSSLAQLRSNTSETDAQQSSLADLATTIAFPGNPLTEFAAQDLRPSAGNNLVGNAEPLPNINQGAGATIGAYEPGQALPAYGPR